MGDVTKTYPLGHASVSFNGTDCGFMKDVKATIQKVTHEAMIPQFAAPVDAIHGGEVLQVEGNILQRDYAILEAVLADCGAKVVGTATTGTKFTLGKVGGSQVTSGELVVSSSIYTTEDFTMHKAFLASCQPTVMWSPEGVAQDGFAVVFRSLVDGTKSNGDYLGSVGVNDASVA